MYFFMTGKYIKHVLAALIQEKQPKINAKLVVLELDITTKDKQTVSFA
jgi:hypothetical protein